jgi:ABC-type fe3+-hydroxamate transport system, periplasmic component
LPLKSGFVTIPLYYQKYNERVFIMKQRFKKHVALILISLMLLSLIGCGKPASTETTGTTTEAAVTEAPAASISDAATTADSTPADASEEGSDAQTVYPVTVTDQAGREVTIEKEPESIVSGYYISTSLLLALGLKDKVTGIEAKADKRPIYKLAAPEFLELPNVGTAKEFDLETCASLSPELVILPMKLKDAAQSLSELDIPVLLVNPESEDQLEQMIELVSTATNTKENADALLSYIDEKKEMLEKDLSGGDAESVYLAGNSSLLSTAGPAMYQSGLIELAGGKNAASEITDTYWAEISYEQLLAWDPSYIILASDAEYTPEDVLNDENLKECTAVKNGNVYAIPGDIEALDSPVPGGILASIWLAGILHPDQVSADMYTEERAAFYETFYGIK